MRQLALIAVLLAACAPALPLSDGGYDADSGTISCLPDLNGSIVASQLQPTLGVPANFLISPQGPVDLVGSVNAQGQQLWDWSTPNQSDQLVAITATALTGKWYADSFPNGQYVVPFDAADTIEDIYRTTDTGVELYGLASAQQHPSKGETLLVYGAPVSLYEFPITPGLNWTATGTESNAMLNGLPYNGTDTYAVAIDGSGILALPDLTFTQVIRVRTTTTVTPAAGETVTTRQVSFFSQCFGEVARATSLPNESNENFTTAAEIRRLGFSGD